VTPVSASPDVANEGPTPSGPQTPAPEPRRPPSRALDRSIRIAGVIIAILAALLSGLLELFFSPLRLGGIPIGVAIPMAVVANAGIAWFAVATTGRRWALGPPWASWTLLMLVAAGVRTTEGDYLLNGDNWVALIMILVGSLTFAVYSYRLILQGPPAPER
jgi:hypothetical protein